MEEKATILESIVEKAEDLGRTHIELFKLKAVDKSADVASSIVANIGVLVVLFLFITILSIGISLWIGEILGKTYYGFFIVAGAYGVITLALQLFKKQLLKMPVNNSIIVNFLK